MTFAEMKDRHEELSLQQIAGSATDAQRAELRELEEAHPEFHMQYLRLVDEAGLMREISPLLKTLEAAPEAPSAAIRDRLHASVRAALNLTPSGKAPIEVEPSHAMSAATIWRLALVGTAVFALAFFLSQQTRTGPPPPSNAKAINAAPPTQSKRPSLLLAIFDPIGPRRPPGDLTPREQFARQWPEAKLVKQFKNLEVGAQEAAQWQALPGDKDSDAVIRIVYDRTQPLLRVTLDDGSGATKAEEFKDEDLSAAIHKAKKKIAEWASQ